MPEVVAAVLAAFPAAPAPGDPAAMDAVDHFQERAAIREHCGGQPRAVAEAAALLEAAQAAGVEPDDLRALLRKVNVASG